MTKPKQVKEKKHHFACGYPHAKRKKHPEYEEVKRVCESNFVSCPCCGLLIYLNPKKKEP